jgi:hypothetical protein
MSQLLCLALPPGPLNPFHSFEHEYVHAMHELDSHSFNN